MPVSGDFWAMLPDLNDARTDIFRCENRDIARALVNYSKNAAEQEGYPTSRFKVVTDVAKLPKAVQEQAVTLAKMTANDFVKSFAKHGYIVEGPYSMTHER